MNERHEMRAVQRGALRRRLRERAGDAGGDGGSVLVLVLVVAVVLIAVTTVALGNASSSSGQTGAYVDRTTARLDAESGFQAAVVQMKDATSPSGLPACSGSATAMAYGSYTVSVAYASGGSALSCPLPGVLPSAVTAVVTSTGRDRAAATEIQGTVTLDAVPTPLPAFDYAVYTPSSIGMDSQAVVEAGTSTALPSLYAGGAWSCTNSNVIQGNVEVGSLSKVLSGSCTIGGTLYVGSGAVQVADTVNLGALQVFGGSLEMDNYSVVRGDVDVTAGGATFGNPTPIIGGSLYASGAYVHNAGAPTVGGTVCTGSASCIPAGVAMPKAPPFPQVTDPGDSGWPAGTTYVPIAATGSGTDTCGSFFNLSYSHSGAGPSPFTQLVDASTAPTTVIDAPGCAVDLPGGQSGCTGPGISTESLDTNLVLFVQSFQDWGCNIFQSASSSSHTVAIVVPYGDGTGGITGTNSTVFDPSVSVLLYTPGPVSFNSNVSMTGQIVAGGPVYFTNNFTDVASNAAASVIPTAVQPWSVQVVVSGEHLVTS